MIDETFHIRKRPLLRNMIPSDDPRKLPAYRPMEERTVSFNVDDDKYSELFEQINDEKDRILCLYLTPKYLVLSPSAFEIFVAQSIRMIRSCQVPFEILGMKPIVNPFADRPFVILCDPEIEWLYPERIGRNG